MTTSTPSLETAVMVHIPKTGGTSVSRALGVTRDHMPITDRPEGWRFAFVRNPWDRAFSWWRYSNLRRRQSFRMWVLAGLDPKWTMASPTRRVEFHDQLGWITVDGEVAVDFLGRFERLHEDYARLCSILGVPVRPLTNENDRGGRVDDYRHHWTEEMLEVAAPWLEPVGDALGYSFGDAPLGVTPEVSP